MNLVKDAEQTLATVRGNVSCVRLNHEAPHAGAVHYGRE